MINGCTFCVDMHGREALADGESVRQVPATSVWHDSPSVAKRERAALALTDAVTRVQPPPDA
jgi:alkylhydroperoxidase family enzyme